MFLACREFRYFENAFRPPFSRSPIMRRFIGELTPRSAKCQIVRLRSANANIAQATLVSCWNGCVQCSANSQILERCGTVAFNVRRIRRFLERGGTVAFNVRRIRRFLQRGGFHVRLIRRFSNGCIQRSAKSQILEQLRSTFGEFADSRTVAFNVRGMKVNETKKNKSTSHQCLPVQCLQGRGGPLEPGCHLLDTASTSWSQ